MSINKVKKFNRSKKALAKLIVHSSILAYKKLQTEEAIDKLQVSEVKMIIKKHSMAYVLAAFRDIANKIGEVPEMEYEGVKIEYYIKGLSRYLMPFMIKETIK